MTLLEVLVYLLIVVGFSSVWFDWWSSLYDVQKNGMNATHAQGAVCYLFAVMARDYEDGPEDDQVWFVRDHEWGWRTKMGGVRWWFKDGVVRRSRRVGDDRANQVVVLRYVDECVFSSAANGSMVCSCAAQNIRMSRTLCRLKKVWSCSLLWSLSAV